MTIDSDNLWILQILKRILVVNKEDWKSDFKDHKKPIYLWKNIYIMLESNINNVSHNTNIIYMDDNSPKYIYKYLN